MLKVRLKYGHNQKGKHLSHLETMRALERAFRRIDFPYVLTSGFSPHLKMSFGPPLPVGYESNSEIVDFFIDKKIDLNEFLKSCWEKFPEALFPVEVRYIYKKTPSLMSVAESAGYLVDVSATPEFMDRDIREKISNFQEGYKLPYKRRDKELLLEFNKDVFVLKSLDSCNSHLIFEFMCSIKGNRNIRPEVFFKYFFLSYFPKTCIKIVNIKRVGIFFRLGYMRKGLMEL
ncbi:MAG: TIGR03936 family radical SAM-associated protein [Actinomycetia bacterium]|nr:TIGR03936 family radical SAM-associated protein [Actinomycetes bacterium]